MPVKSAEQGMYAEILFASDSLAALSGESLLEKRKRMYMMVVFGWRYLP